MKSGFAKLPFILLAAIFVIHAAFIVHYAVDVPIGDQWDTLNSDQLPSGLSLSWLFRLQNEHRLVPTKLLAWILLKTTAWNLNANLYVNFAIFGLFSSFFFVFQKRVASSVSASLFAWFLIFLVSSIADENHALADQSCHHFVLLFFFLSVYFLFSSKQLAFELFLGSLCALASTYAFANGIVLSAVVIACYAWFKWDRARVLLTASAKRVELIQAILVIGVVGGGILLWLLNYHRNLAVPPPTWPNKLGFWVVFFDLVALGFGYRVSSVLIGVVCTLAVVVPLWLLWKRTRPGNRDSFFALAAAILGVLGSLASVAFGRAGFGLGSGKTPRYAELAIVLIPPMVMAWGLALQQSKRDLRRAFVFLWLLCLGGYSNTNNWNFFHYRYYQQLKLKGLNCLSRYVHEGGPPVCSTLYPGSLAERLENAKRMKISFMETLARQPDLKPKN